MTSHYMRCSVRGSYENVFDSLSSQFGSIYSRRIKKESGLKAGVVIGEEHFFRIESDAAIMIILDEVSADETKAEIISWAGGKGLFGVSYGAHDTYVYKVRDFLADSFPETTVEEEISYFDSSKTPTTGEP